LLLLLLPWLVLGGGGGGGTIWAEVLLGERKGRWNEFGWSGLFAFAFPAPAAAACKRDGRFNASKSALLCGPGLLPATACSTLARAGGGVGSNVIGRSSGMGAAGGDDDDESNGDDDDDDDESSGRSIIP
jgi:hypothetical protein